MPYGKTFYNFINIHYLWLMHDLKYWQEKIRNKRKNTNFRDFLKELWGWYPVVFNKNSWMISRYPETDRINICTIKEFEDNRDDLIKNWFDYDFSIDFFKNFLKLFKSVKHPNFITYNINKNCDYSDAPAGSNNCYLSSVVVLWSENVYYTYVTRCNVVNIFNSLYVADNSENIYFWTWIISSFNVFYSRYIKNSSNIWFCSNLVWCSECIFCNDLENASYCINNQKYEKQDYLKKKQEILKQKENFLDYYKKLEKNWKNHGSTNTTWNFVTDSEDIENWNFVYNTKNARNVFFAWAENWNSNIFDAITCWWWGWDDLYWVINSWWLPTHLYSVAHSGWSHNCHYCYMMENCSFCIWCIWLKNKNYCILNKEYSKQEWEILADKIFESMEKDWILWDFFPWYMSPFYFNDTIAWIFWNFTKQEVSKDWYMWRDEEIKVDVPDDAQIIYSNLLPPRLRGTKRESNEVSNYQWYDENWNWQINPEILEKVIKDDKWNIYRIIKPEYEFLIKYALPIPEIHWSDRLKVNFWIE